MGCCQAKQSSRVAVTPTSPLCDRNSSTSNIHNLSNLLPGMSRQLDLSTLRRQLGNHITISSSKNAVEFVHGEVQHAEMKLGEEGFVIHHLVGTGGFGFVFKASRKTTGVDYALKVQPLEFLAGLNGKTNEVSLQLEKTALVVCRDSPFIVNLDYAFCSPLYAILALEYVPGGTLSQLISSRGRLPPALARIYTAEISLALNFVHEKGIIYRDLKPSNVLIDCDGHIKLTDFGLAGSMLQKRRAKVINPQENSLELGDGNSSDNASSSLSSSDEGPGWTDDDETSEGKENEGGDLRRVRRRTLCGTCGYRPPELVGQRYIDYHNRSGYDERVDIFSLGVTLFTMVCGSRPFPTRKQMMMSQMSQPSSPTNTLSEKNTSALQRAATRQLLKDLEFRCLMTELKFPDFLSEETALKNLIEQLLAKDPNDRPRFETLANHEWMEGVEFDADKLRGTKIEFDFVHEHVHSARPKRMRRSSMMAMNQSKPKTLSKFINDICDQIVELGKEDAETATKRWMTVPSASTINLFRSWNYVSDDALRLEIDAAKNLGLRSSRRHMRRATQ